MELFSCENTLSHKDCLRFMREFFWCRFRLFVVLLIALQVFFCVVAKDITYALVAVIFIIYLIVALEFLARRTYKTNKLLADTEKYAFFEDRFTATTAHSYSEIKYEQLYRIFETKGYFFLMISSNQGYILPKVRCDNALCAFLHGMAQKKRNKK